MASEPLSVAGAPSVWVGMWQVGGERVADVARWALKAGLRNFDTATRYGNEEALGAALREALQPGDPFRVSTKVWNADHGRARVMVACREASQRLGVGPIHRVLLHWPVPTRGLTLDSYRGLLDAQEAGLVRTVGVSNFDEACFPIIEGGDVAAPVVNQIELHPAFANKAGVAASTSRGIPVEAWSPLGSGMLLGHPVIAEAARETGASPAQVILAWHLGAGRSVAVRATSEAHLWEASEARSLVLPTSVRSTIDEMDGGRRFGPDPAVFDSLA